MKKSNIIELKFRKASKVFPSVRRYSPHDLMNLSVTKKKFLTKPERFRLQAMADFDDKKGFSGYSDILVERNGRKVRFIPF